MLSWLRRSSDGTAVLVALNLSATEQTVSFDLQPQGVNGAHASTLLSSFSKPGRSVELKKVVLPAYGSWIAEIGK